VLELEQLSRRYGDNVALDDLSFDVRPGDVVGFLGPNGAGKTTAMRAILGIVRPDSGEVRWNGKLVDLPARLRFGYIPEERGLYPTMTLIDQLAFLGRLHGMSRALAKEKAAYWLDVLGLDGRLQDRLDALSLGNQQRVQLAASLLHAPDVLVLDEPFSGLDPVGIEALSDVLAEQARNGVAVVFSSHQLDLVEGLCERVVIIDKGRKVLEGEVETLATASQVLAVKVRNDTVNEWARSLAHVEVLSSDVHGVRLHLSEGASPSDILDTARAAGEVVHFSFERKRLSEVFREAVVQ
jgi:ABC-2 type transport system ATP-binding protein